MAKVEWKNYICTLCANIQSISTNHNDACLNYCNDCSWKGEGFGEGVRMFGTVHRVFKRYK